MKTVANLDNTFNALADPTRRAILLRLRGGEALTLSELASPFEMTLPGVMKHVGILEKAGLVEREKVGRTVYCRLNLEPMADAMRWLEEMEQFWAGSLDRLGEHVESAADGRDPPMDGAPATKSSRAKKKE